MPNSTRVAAVGALVLVLGATPGASQSRVQVFRAPTNVSVAQVIALPSGNLLLRGNTTATEGGWIAELAPDGALVRQARLSAADPPILQGMHATPDGGVVLFGHVRAHATSNPYDAFLLKLDPSWTIEWQTCHGVPTSNEIPYGIQAVSDGGWLVHGNTAGGGLLMRFDSSGAVMWEQRCSMTGLYVSLARLAPLGGDRWLLAYRAQAASTDLDQVLFAEIDADGVVTNARLLDTPNQDIVASIHVLSDGSAWITGAMNVPAGNPQVSVAMHRTAGGVVDLVRGVQGPGAQIIARASATLPSGGLVVASYFSRSPNGDQIALVELDAAGVVVRTNVVGGTADDGVADMTWTSRGLVAVGSTRSIDGAASPSTGLLLLLDDDLHAPPACSLDQVTTLTPLLLTPTETSTSVTTTLLTTAAPSVVPIAIVPGVLASSIECGGTPMPPREVSPTGAATPLLVRDHGVLTWEDGAFSGSDSFDVHRGDLTTLRARDYGACWQTAILPTTATDAALPGVGNGWFYLVAGRNAVGLGPVGYDSLGVESVPPARCP